jgi:ketosteroid isomerase-like protein
MTTLRLKMALPAVAFFTIAAILSPAQMPSSKDSDSAAIKQCVAAWEDAWNRHDAQATAAAYVEDGDFSSTTGVPSHGEKELEAHYAEIFTTFLKDAHRTDGAFAS